jgi:hypothetical protein
MNQKMLFGVSASPIEFDTIDIRVGAQDEQSRQFFAAGPLTMCPKTPGQLIDPCMSLSREAARELMDQLWTVGIRPKEFKETSDAGVIAALQDHLADLRKAYEKLLNGRR